MQLAELSDNISPHSLAGRALPLPSADPAAGVHANVGSGDVLFDGVPLQLPMGDLSEPQSEEDTLPLIERPAAEDKTTGCRERPDFTGYGLSLAVHLMWGCHPVLARYLQVLSPTPMSGLVIVVMGQVLSGSLMWATEAAANILYQKRAAGREAREGSNSWWRNKRARALAGMFAVFTTMRVATNILSVMYTPAYNTQLVQSLSPVVVALMEKAVLCTQLPDALWPTLFLLLVGIGLVGLGQSPLINGTAALTWRDATGVALQLTSVVFSAASRILMSLTKTLIDKSDLLQVQNVSNSVLILAVTLVASPKDWLVVLSMTAWTWTAFFAMTIIVYGLGKYYQVEVIRRIGPGMHASFQALRVLVAVAGSAVLLGEPVRSGWEWAGLLLTCTTLTGWLAYLVLKDKHQPS